jgi:hypothetical protein
LLTLADIAAVVYTQAVHMVHQKLKTMVALAPSCVANGSGSECTCHVFNGAAAATRCAYCVTNGSEDKNNTGTGTRPKKMAAMTTEFSSWRPSPGSHSTVASQHLFRQKFGMPAEFTTGPEAVLMRASISQCVAHILDTWNLTPAYTDAPIINYDNHSTTSSSSASLSTTTTSSLTTFCIEGLTQLKAAQWDIQQSLRRYMPPCLAILVDTCNKRHLKYPERQLVIGWLASLSGIHDGEENSNGYVNAWMRLFAHHTDRSTRQKFFPLDASTITTEARQRFLSSEYGKAVLDDARKCPHQRRPGCKAAESNDLCPFASIIKTHALTPAMVQTITDIEDTPTRSIPTTTKERLDAIWNNVNAPWRKSAEIEKKPPPPLVEQARWFCGQYLQAFPHTKSISVYSPISTYNAIIRANK